MIAEGRKHLPPGRVPMINQAVILRLVEPNKDNGKNVTIDNQFTSISLAHVLYDLGLTCVGTLRYNNPGVPLILRAPYSKKDLCIVVVAFSEK